MLNMPGRWTSFPAPNNMWLRYMTHYTSYLRKCKATLCLYLDSVFNGSPSLTKSYIRSLLTNEMNEWMSAILSLWEELCMNQEMNTLKMCSGRLPQQVHQIIKEKQGRLAQLSIHRHISIYIWNPTQWCCSPYRWREMSLQTIYAAALKLPANHYQCIIHQRDIFGS